MRLVTTIVFLVAISSISGCTVGFDANQDGVFQCDDDEDCADGFRCSIEGTCVSNTSTATGCVDSDQDGWCSSGNLAESPNCATNPTACNTADCDDSSPTAYPGADDVCDGVDNDCDGTTDEVLSCETLADCPPSEDAASSQAVCNQGVCEYVSYTPTSPGCGDPLACVEGERQTPPPGC